MISPTGIAVAILATLRLGMMLVWEDSMENLRIKAGVRFVDSDGKSVTYWGRQLQCFWCTTMWLSVPISSIVLLGLWHWLLPFAVSGGAVLLGGGGRLIWRYMVEGQ